MSFGFVSTIPATSTTVRKFKTISTKKRKSVTESNTKMPRPPLTSKPSLNGTATAL